MDDPDEQQEQDDRPGTPRVQSSSGTTGGYAIIGPIAATIGTAGALAISGVLNALVCLSVLLVPSVRAIRMDGPTPRPEAT